MAPGFCVIWSPADPLDNAWLLGFDFEGRGLLGRMLLCGMKALCELSLNILLPLGSSFLL